MSSTKDVVTHFLNQHHEFGKALSVEDLPDWAKGKRKRVRSDSGKYLLFYLKGDSVATVYEEASGGRSKVWGEYDSVDSPSEQTVAESASLPKYQITKYKKMGGGGWFADAIVPSLSQKTPATERERVARAIALREAVDDLELYATEDAKKANLSAAFSKSHPGVLKRGYLGMLSDGKFTPGEDLN